MRPKFLSLVIVAMILFPASLAHAKSCVEDVLNGPDSILVGVGCTSDSQQQTPGPSQVSTQGPADAVIAVTPDPIRCDETTGACLPNPAYQCTDPDEVYTILYVPNGSGGWQIHSQGCMAPAEEELPTITPGMVLAELRRVGLPALTVTTTPAGKTLVNLETVFHTDPETVTRQLSLLGQAVTVEATPEAFAWDFGDGARDTTADPGRPYPALDITHRYAVAAVTVTPSVTTVYSGRFRVNGGPWADIGGTVTIPGPALPLRVAEATPVLSGNR